MKKKIGWAAMLVIAASAVHAGAPSTVVRYGDLNLNSKEGMKVLQRRVTQAARKVCGYDDGYHGNSDSWKVRACVAKARKDAMEQVERTVAKD